MSAIKLWPFRRSEHELFESLIKPHMNRLYKLAFHFTGQSHDAEDLVQDVLVKLFPRLSEMHSIDKLSPWLSRVLYRHFIDRVRSQQRSPVQFTDNENQLYADNSDGVEQPIQLFESQATQHKLQEALNQLNFDQRLLVMLHDVEGYTLNEIHQMQGTPVGTLKSRLSRSRNKLRKILIQVEPFTEARRVNG